MTDPNILIEQLMQENSRLRADLEVLKQTVPPSREDPKDPIALSGREMRRALLDAIPVAVAWANDKDEIEFTNRKFMELFGYDLTDIPTLQAWFNKAYPDPNYRETTRSKWFAAVERARQSGGDVEGLALHIVCKDGTVRDVVLRASLIGGRTLAVLDDLTESKKARKALLELESRFKSVFDCAMDGILVADSVTMQFYMANTSILNMLGYTEEEIQRLTVADIHPKEALKEVIDSFERMGRSEVHIALNLPVKRKNGEIFYADISSGSMTIDDRRCHIGIFRDISERKKGEDAILQERDFSDAALNSLPGIFYMFDKNGRFLRWNRNFEAVSGYSTEEMNHISPFDMFEGEDKIHIQTRIQDVFEKGASDAEAAFVSKNGTKTPYYFTGLLSHFGGEPYVIGMGIDISRQKQAEKMQALGQLAGGIAHDFNNQLAAILGFAEILAAQLEDGKLRQHAEMIVRAATRSADLTRQLLAFARKGKYQPEPVNMHMIISEVIGLLSRSIDKRITIKQQLSARPCTVIGDPNQIQNAFLNLAINGRDAMPEGGELIFTTAHDFLDKDFCHSATFDVVPGRYLKISVTDTGKGMDDHVQRHLFEPFFTTKKVGEGTGMGLAAVYGTIKNHKGAIVVTSKPGRGSTFDVFLPLAQDVTAAVKPTVSQARSGKCSACILVVDDEGMIRMLTADILKNQGYEVILCKDGKEAEEIYREKWSYIDLVILDLMMPNVSGIETFATLRSINPSAKILISSGYSIDGQAQSLLDDGAVDFAQKPFTVDQLIKKVVTALNSGK